MMTQLPRQTTCKQTGDACCSALQIHTDTKLQAPQAACFRSWPNLGPCCRYDKLLGIYITKGGKVRRMDIILAPSEELQMCLIAWTGSKQYLRFLRQHAINRGMSLSAHRYLYSYC